MRIFILYADGTGSVRLRADPTDFSKPAVGDDVVSVAVRNRTTLLIKIGERSTPHTFVIPEMAHWIGVIRDGQVAGACGGLLAITPIHINLVDLD